jgi:hypothetical protein
MTVTSIDRVFADRPWWCLESNTGFILQASARPYTYANLLVAADSLGEKLAVTQEWDDGWRAFIREHPEYAGAGCGSNKLLAFRKLQPGALPTVENFEEVRGDLAKSLESRAKDEEARERASLIQRISLGKDSYVWVETTGRKITWRTAGLDEEPTERLRWIAEAIEEQRQLQMADPAEIHAALKNTEATQAQKAAEVSLINPETGVQFTRKELVKMIAAQDHAAFHRLLFGPGGYPIKGRREAIDKILGVTPRPEVGHSLKFKV